MKALIVKAGGLLATYEGVRLTKDQMEQSKSEYIYEASTRGGTVVYVDAEKAGVSGGPGHHGGAGHQ